MSSKQISDNQRIALIAYGDARASGDPEAVSTAFVNALHTLDSNDELISALGKVRDLFQAPSPGDALEIDWLEAMSFPESVPQFVEQALEQINQLPTFWGYHMRFNNGVKTTVEGDKDLKQCEAMMDSNESLTRLYTLNEKEKSLPQRINSNKCPVCGSGSIESGSLEADDKIAWADVTCHDCNSEWRDQYVLSGSLVTKKGTVKS